MDDTLVFLRTASEISTNGMVAVDMGRTILIANPAFEAFLGYERGSLVGQSARILYPDDAAFDEQGRSNVSPSLARGAEYQVRLRHRDGSPVSTLIRTRIIAVDDRLIGYLSVVENLASQERRARFLQEMIDTCSEPTLSTREKIDALLATGCGFFGLEIGIVSEVEDAQYRITHIHGGDGPMHVDASFPLGQTYCEAVVAASSAKAFHHAGAGPQAGHPCYAGTGLEAYIGTPLVVRGRRRGTVNFSSREPRAQPFTQEDLSLVMSLAGWIGNEMAAAAQTAAILAERERFERLYRRTPVMMHTVDEDDRILEVSDRWSARLGHERADVLGRSSRTLLAEADQATFDQATFDRMRSEPAGIEKLPLTFLARDGEAVEVELSAVRDDSRDDPREAGSTYMVLEEVTDRNRALDDLRSTNAELVRLNKGLRDFAYVASHDLQEPLRKIMQFSSFLHEDHREALPEEGRYFVDGLASSARRMARLIADLLDYSRIANSDVRLVRLPLDEALRAAWSSAGAEHMSKDAERAAGDAELVAEPLPEIEADADLARRLLENLVGNAIKFRRTDRPARVEVSALRTEASILLRVSDDGIGFDPEHSEAIFEPFRRLHHRDAYAGSGIGLTLCRAICDRLGWTITASGAEGGGAVFTIEIARAGEVATEARATTGEPSGPSERIVPMRASR